ncbi:S-adenosyl-L-methionine-dependent methyltransferase [Phaeosphaeriaceae sp. PMI808]|nr:S-adenosyl-L-methionine-dependent methyltransferase [Phaeosphaeriaceae sp. PMI808]
MTQPNSVNMTFDTSLIDLNPNVSFSTTESDPSDFGIADPTTKSSTIQQSYPFEDQSQETPKQSQTLFPDVTSQPLKPSTPVQHIATQEAYDQWASIYDNDGNMLQAVDDIELTSMLPKFLTQVQNSVSTSAISLIDLGCGTGRNTEKLLLFEPPAGRKTTVTGLDFSKGMLAIAAEKLPAFNEALNEPRIKLMQCDCFPTVNNPSASPFPSAPGLAPVNAIISTLVLEHVPLSAYFSTLSSLLLPSGLALITNMHSEMGAKSQAGFVNEQGIKVRGSSYAHTVQDTVDEAKRAGFDVLSVKERDVTKEDVQTGMVGERGRKWVGINVWYGVIVQKVR